MGFGESFSWPSCFSEVSGCWIFVVRFDLPIIGASPWLTDGIEKVTPFGSLQMKVVNTFRDLWGLDILTLQEDHLLNSNSVVSNNYSKKIHTENWGR